MNAAVARGTDLSRGRRGPGLAAALLIAVLATLVPLSLSVGAAAIPVERVIEIISGQYSPSPGAAREALIVFQIRLPRLALGLTAGAALGLAGALMQGLFGIHSPILGSLAFQLAPGLRPPQRSYWAIILPSAYCLSPNRYCCLALPS